MFRVVVVMVLLVVQMAGVVGDAVVACGRVWVVSGPCLVSAVAAPGWGVRWVLVFGRQSCWCLGSGGGDVGVVSWLLSFRVTSFAGVARMVLWALASLVMPRSGCRR